MRPPVNEGWRYPLRLPISRPHPLAGNHRAALSRLVRTRQRLVFDAVGSLQEKEKRTSGGINRPGRKLPSYFVLPVTGEVPAKPRERSCQLSYTRSRWLVGQSRAL